MSDNNRLELVLSIVDENTASATAKARANMRSFVEEAVKAAQGASNSLDKVTVELARSFEKASSSAMSSLDRLEARAALAGKRGVDRLVAERQQRISALGEDEAAIKRVTAAYDKLITAQKKGGEGEHGGTSSMVLRRGFLAVKDFGEGRVQGTMAEVADILFGQGGSGGVVQKAIPELAEITGLSSGAIIAIGGLTAAFAGLGFAGIESMKSLAEAGEEIRKFSVNTGIAPTRVQAFQFAAKAAGADPSVFQRISSEISRGADDTSEEGAKKRDQLGRLGVNLYDRFGDLKPTEQVLLDVADGLDKLSPGLERNAAAARLFGESSKEVLPVLEGLRRNLNTSDEIGNTFSEHDLQMMDRWHESLTRMGEEWKRFKLQLEVPLAVIGEITIKGIKLLGIAGGGGIGIGSGPARQLGETINSMLFQQGEIAAPGADPNALKKAADKDLADQARERLRSLQERDPAFRLNEARRKLTTYDTLAQHGSADDVQQAIDQFNVVKQLEGKKAGNKDLEAAAKERQQLLSESAQIAESAQQKSLSASLDSRRELSTPEDIDRLMDLAKRRAIAEEQRFIADHADANGRNSAQFLDAANANLPQRIENEQAKVLADIAAQDARYFRARTDADAKAWEESWQRRKRGELELQDEEIRTRQQIQSKQFDINGSTIDRQRDIALQGLDGVNAQTLQQKTALEDQKLAIEQDYAERSLANQIAKLQNEQSLDIAEIQKRAAQSGNSGSDAEAADIAAARDRYQQQIDAARGATSDREIIDAQKAQAAKEKLQIESNRKVYDSLKQDAAGLFDQLVSHTKSWGDFAKDLFKSAILTPIKDIFSSQVAAFFTKAVTGESVKFGEVGNGQGTFGKLGSIFGRAGLGPATFGDANHPLSKLNAPNHLGDLSLVSGAVPVVLMNQGAAGQRTVSNNFSFSSLATGLGLGGLLGAATSGAAESVTSSISYDTGSAANSYKLLGGIVDGTNSPGNFGSLAKLVGGPGGTSGFAGPVSGYGSSGSSGGGVFSNLGSSIFGGLGKLFGRGGGSSEIDGETGLPLGHDIPGSADNSSGETGSGIGGAAGAALLSIGSGLVMDSLRRKPGLASGIETPLGAGMIGAKFGGKGGALIGAGIGLGVDGVRRGGVTGTLEDAGGGALIGFQLGGPAGALAGAAIGAGVGLFRMLFKTDRQHAKDLVKQVYGMDINNATADQIIAIAKQAYGGQIDVAVRSPQVRDLLKLYAQTTGQKSAQDQFVQSQVHSASFVENGGKLQQQAVYDNGNAYSYSSPLSVYGGVQTSPLSTFAPNQGVFNGNLQINLNGQSASDALAGQVVRVATPSFVQGQALAASNSSIGRTAQQNMTLSPSALRS